MTGYVVYGKNGKMIEKCFRCDHYVYLKENQVVNEMFNSPEKSVIIMTSSLGEENSPTFMAIMTYAISHEVPIFMTVNPPEMFQ